MDLLTRRTLRLALLLLVSALALACGDDVYPAHGTVHDVDRENAQVLIEHDDIPGLMPAMTMNFAVRDEGVLAALAPGQVVDFELEFTGDGYYVVSVTPVGEVGPEEGWVKLDGALQRTDPVPPTRLVDENGAPFDLASLRGKTLLVDFIFTSCPGPCPILTTNHVAAQRALPEAARERVHFVSISLDPRTDTPDVLRTYAEKRGADLDHWTLLTGPEPEVAAVVRAWGVGSTRAEDGSIEHMVISFLVDGEGRIVRRYLGHDDPPEAIAGDLAELAGVAS